MDDNQLGPLPWETLYPRQLELFNTGVAGDCEAHPNCPPAILCDGPRYSTKTIGVAHRVIRHMWDTPKARVALVVKTTGSATDGGVWCDLLEHILPIWFEAGIGCEFKSFDRTGLPGPRTNAKTRTIYFTISNFFRGESELRLIPIKHEDEIEPRLKSGRFSCVWVSEVSNFNDWRIFLTPWEQLRMLHLKKWQHLWIGDTNPSEDGPDSWIYKFFIARSANYNLLIDKAKELGGHPNLGAAELNASIRRMQFTLAHNIGMSPIELQVREAMYADDEGKLERDFKGNWVKGSGRKGKHFADVFSRSIHVIGDDTDEIELNPTTSELFTGWDIGEVNHAAGIVEKRYVQSADKSVEWSVWSVLSSFLFMGEQKGIHDLALEMLDRMDAILRDYPGRVFEWIHYADDSALTMWRPSSQTFDYQEILIATEKRIELTGVPKPAGSVHGRVRLVKRLLREKRLFVAGQCTEVIDMFEGLRKGTTKADYIMWESHKHVFDWLSYILWMEMTGELDLVANRPHAREKNSGSGYVGIPLLR